MRYLTFLLVLLSFCALPGNCQESDSTPLLLARFAPGGSDVLQGIYHLQDRLVSSFDAQEDTLAIRICSSDPLSVSLALAEGEPFLGAGMAKERGVLSSRIVFLRTEKQCPRSGRAVTEYWRVKKDQEMPYFVESRNYDNVADFLITGGGFYFAKNQIASFSGKGIPLDNDSFRGALLQLGDRLQADRSALAIITIRFFSRRPPELMNRNVNKIKKLASDRGISASRMIFRFLPNLAGTNLGIEDPQYPDILVISERIALNCK